MLKWLGLLCLLTGIAGVAYGTFSVFSGASNGMTLIGVGIVDVMVGIFLFVQHRITSIR